MLCHLHITRLLFRLLKLLTEPAAFLAEGRAEYQYLIIRHINSEMRRLRQALFREENVYGLSQWPEKVRGRAGQSARLRYEELHQRIKGFIHQRMGGLAVQSHIHRAVDTLDNP